MPLRIIFTREADKDVDDLIEFISIDSPSAAKAIAARIEKSLRLLTKRPFLGRLAPETGRETMRRLSIPPYIVFYLVSPDALQVIRVLHGARHLDDPRLFRP